MQLKNYAVNPLMTLDRFKRNKSNQPHRRLRPVVTPTYKVTSMSPKNCSSSLFFFFLFQGIHKLVEHILYIQKVLISAHLTSLILPSEIPHFVPDTL